MDNERPAADGEPRLLDVRSFGAKLPVARLLVRFGALLLASVAASVVAYGHLTSTPEIELPPGSPPEFARELGHLMSTVQALLVAVPLAVVPPLVYLAVAFAPWWRSLANRVVWRLGQRSLPAAPVRTVAGCAEGQWILVRGHVRPAPGFTSLGGRQGTVVASYLGSVGGLREQNRATFAWELHGVDFSLAIGGGEVVGVRLDNATLAGAPTGFSERLLAGRPVAVQAPQPGEPADVVASLYEEETIGAGDEVEVFGLLRREVDATVDALARSPRVRPLLTGKGSGRLLLRPVRPRT